MSQSFMKIGLLVFELCAKVCALLWCHQSGDTTLRAGAHKLDHYPFRKMRKSQDSSHSTHSKIKCYRFFFLCYIKIFTNGRGGARGYVIHSEKLENKNSTHSKIKFLDTGGARKVALGRGVICSEK